MPKITVEPTERQKKVVDIQAAKGCSTAAAMREAGFSPITARNPQKLTKQEGYIKYKEQVVKRLDEQREKALMRMDKTIDTAKYSDAANTVDKFSKIIQLLTGGATSNVNVNVRNMSNEELINLID